MEVCQSAHQIHFENGCSSVRVLPRFALYQLLTFKVPITMITPIIALMMLSACAGETENLKSLGEIKNLQIFGDSIAIVSKNDSEPAAGDDLEKYLKTHVVRIKSPLHDDKFYDFDMNYLVPDDEVEGRKKRKGLQGLFLPFLMILKKKAMMLAVFMAMVAFLALKGFWAGMTGLFISKLVALKLLLDAQNKKEGNEEEDHDEEDDHSPAYVHYEVPNQHSYHGRQDGGAKPIVIYLNHDQKSKYTDRFQIIRKYYGTDDWDYLEEQSDADRHKWEDSPIWDQGLW